MTRTRAVSRALRVALAAMVAATLAACAQGGQSAGADDTIKIGALIATTGPAGSIGVGIENGIELAVSDVNAAGGVKVGSTSYKLAVSHYDTAGDPATGLTQLTRMVENDDIHFLIGPDTSSVGNAILPFLQQHQQDLPVIVAGAGLGPLTKVPSVFRMNPTIAEYNKQNIKFQVALGAKRATIVTDIKHAGEVEATPQTVADYQASGIDLISQETMQTGQTDFTSMIGKIRAANPDVVFLRMYADEQLLFVKQARQLGWNIPITGVNATPLDRVGVAIPAAAMTNVYEVSPPTWANLEADGSAAAKQAVTEYKGRFNADPGGLTFVGYEAVKALAGSLTQAGTVDPGKVIGALQQLKPYAGQLYPLNAQGGVIFGPGHEISVDFVAAKWENGKIVDTESVK
ncbi:amino acid ABC transporter substrate-binding protein [Pseudonocardia ailaonensis]|uniref:Amino acid ABC transporter substrate-binding protein n=1 Tax=Pseudonocardia ailaonensis TaxID=367279 RepID=A0ABN2MZB5_9PSEU